MLGGPRLQPPASDRYSRDVWSGVSAAPGHVDLESWGEG